MIADCGLQDQKEELALEKQESSSFLEQFYCFWIWKYKIVAKLLGHINLKIFMQRIFLVEVNSGSSLIFIRDVNDFSDYWNADTYLKTCCVRIKYPERSFG